MLKRHWHHFLLLLLLADLGYSFWQYQQFPLDGDLAPIVWPDQNYVAVLHDPFGLRALLKHEMYSAPNRFFAHYFIYEYFRHVPLWLHTWLSPLDSLYFACALVKLAVHLLILYVFGAAISNSRNVLGKSFVLAAVLVTPLLQACGFYEKMGVLDWSITYTCFYALPLSLLLLFFLPFLRAALHGTPVRLSALGYVAEIGLIVWLSLNGPTIPATVLLVCPVALLVVWYRRFAVGPATEPVVRRFFRAIGAMPRAVIWLFGLFILTSLYSLYIGTFNAENLWATLPLAERYARLPLGVYYQLSSKLGFPLLLLLLLVNGWLIRRQAGSPAARRVLTALQWLGAFALVYVLLLPLGGYREYRHYIIRRDSILPVILGMMGFFALSAYYLLTRLSGAAHRRYAAAIAVFLGIFTFADKPRRDDFNACEKQLFARLAQAPGPIVRLPADCTMMDWQPLTDYKKSELNGQMLHYWGVLDTPKLYYQR